MTPVDQVQFVIHVLQITLGFLVMEVLLLYADNVLLVSITEVLVFLAKLVLLELLTATTAS